MSKRRQTSQPKQQRTLLYIALGVVVVLIAGVALFMSRGTASATLHISPTEYQSQFISSNTPHFLLDVRTPDEFATGHIHGAANIAVETLENHLSEVPRDEPVVVYCHSGNRSAQAARILAQAGYTNVYDLGGINTWEAQGFPVE